ncbi:DUF2318 domain-containing protein [bacterium]|nr:MAG: DUF2318 domain-containing protein [bacterium]
MSKKYLFFIIIFIAIIAVYFLIHSNQEQTKEKNQPAISQSGNRAENKQTSQPQFLGEEGEAVDLVDGQVNIIADMLNDNLARYYHTKLPNGKIIYFFVVKDRSGVYRAAANACQVCYDARMGFRQEGDFMVCNTCGNKYPLEKIATEKGSCNPGPINPDLEVRDGRIFIKQSDLEQVSNFF